MLESTSRPQSIDELKEHYCGKTDWNSDSGTFTFTSSGVINFNRDNAMAGIWTVPKQVRMIRIKAKVRVTGQFTCHSDCTIEGEKQDSSEIFGTNAQRVLQDMGLAGGGGCIPYSAILGYGNIELYVRNLTILNPIGFMWTGKDGAKIHLDDSRGIDDRGGSFNHSDGISAASGSTVRNCYLETGDDAIKVYQDIVVENTIIKMIQNTVPIQLGWRSRDNKSKGTFRNLTIIGDCGRGEFRPIIQGRHGKYSSYIDIDGLTVRNPNAALVSLCEDGMELDLVIKNGDIIEQFWGEKNGVCRGSINGSKIQSC